MSFMKFVGTLLSVLSALAALSSNQASAQKNESSRKFVLSVGISDYKDTRWPKLRYTVSDASAIADYFRQQQDDVTLLHETADSSGITLDRFRAALQELGQKNSREDDTVLVYISTHGTLGRVKDSGSTRIQKFLITSDSNYEKVSETALRFHELMDWFKSLKSRRKALIIDACYSGGGKAHLTPAMLNFLAQQRSGALKEPDDEALEGTAVYTASAWGEEAREEESLGHGVYTYYLLKAFDQDPNSDGGTQLSEAHAIASNWVIEHTQGAQHPSAQLEFIGRDPIVVRGLVKRPTLPYIMTLHKEFRRYMLRFNGKSMGTLAKGLVELPEGAARLEVIDPQTQRVIAERSVELFANETYTLENLLFEQKRNQLDFSMSQLQFASRQSHKRLSPHPLNAVGIEYQRQGLMNNWNGVVSIRHLNSSNGQIQVSEKLLDQTVEQTENRSLGGWQFASYLQSKRRLPAWTPGDQRWITNLHYGLGLSWLALERRFDEPALEKSSERWAAAPGLSARTLIDLFIPIRNIHTSLGLEYSVYQDRFATQQEIVGVWQYGLHFGLLF